jgi:hypothetical protein
MVSLHRANWHIPDRVPDFISQADYWTAAPAQDMKTKNPHMGHSLSKVLDLLALSPDKTSA